jgi:hypothetical protein
LRQFKGRLCRLGSSHSDENLRDPRIKSIKTSVRWLQVVYRLISDLTSDMRCLSTYLVGLPCAEIPADGSWLWNLLLEIMKWFGWCANSPGYLISRHQALLCQTITQSTILSEIWFAYLMHGTCLNKKLTTLMWVCRAGAALMIRYGLWLRVRAGPPSKHAARIDQKWLAEPGQCHPFIMFQDNTQHDQHYIVEFLYVSDRCE